MSSLEGSPTPHAHPREEAAPAKSRGRQLWTFRELCLLRKRYPYRPRREVLEALPRWTWPQIKMKAHRLGLPRRSMWLGRMPRARHLATARAYFALPYPARVVFGR